MLAEHCKTFFESLGKRPFAWSRLTDGESRGLDGRFVSRRAMVIGESIWAVAGVLDPLSAGDAELKSQHGSTPCRVIRTTAMPPGIGSRFQVSKWTI
jgi:hypothetical protein